MKKILPRNRHRTKQQTRVKERGTAESQSDAARLQELEKENSFLTQENKKLQSQLEFWRDQAESDSVSEDEHHWRRRYSVRNEEAQNLENLLGLRGSEIAKLKKELTAKNARIEKLRKQLFDRTSEKEPIQSNTEVADSSELPSTETPPVKPVTGRNRGGQPGTSRTGPQHHDGLSVDETIDYTLNEQCCSDCGELWNEVSTQESDEVVVSVRAYRRRHRRKKYGHFCKKKGHWVTNTAPGANRLFRNSMYGISFWVFLLVGRYVLHMPTNRLRMQLEQHNLSVSQGTITGGFKRIVKLIKPLITELKRYSREDKHHWHIDDTGWKVFVKVEGKDGHGWYLWVFRSSDVCVFIVSPSRARAVPKSHLEHSSGVVTSDRLAANQKLGDFIDHSYCWVHERREFRVLATGYPELFSICDHFLKLIGSLFHYNKLRLSYEHGSAQFVEFQDRLRETLEQILKDCKNELDKSDLHSELRRVFKGIVKDWDGLRLFLELDAVPPDNNPAEQAIRGPVNSRKSCYGSGSKWSAEFMADMYSLTETLKYNGINAESFLTDYFERCAANGGKPPKDAVRLLPWNLPPPKT